MQQFTEMDIQAKGILAAAELFGKAYIKANIRNACASITCQTVNECREHFLGFESEGELWTVFVYMAVNVYTGKVRFLDYRLPDGTRMENPPRRVRLS